MLVADVSIELGVLFLLPTITQGIVKPQVDVAALKDVNKVLHELRAGEIRSRKVVVPHTDVNIA